MESILAFQSLREGLVPRSHNADPLDPGVDLAVTVKESVTLNPTAGTALMLKNAFGFGGHNISLVLEAPVGNKPEQPG